MRIYLSVLVIVIGLLLASCDDKDNKSTTSPLPDQTETWLVILMDSVAVDTFYVTEEDEGTVIPICDGEEQIGEVELDVWDYGAGESYGNHGSQFNFIARKPGCYSTFNYTGGYHTVEIDYERDFEAYNPDMNCGVFFAVDSLSGDYYEPVNRSEYEVWNDSLFMGYITLDRKGRFETDIPAGDYTITADLDEYLLTDSLSFRLIEGYAEYTIPTFIYIVEKPNLYLYPQTPTTLDVNISFPRGGRVTVSEPQFPQQWQGIHVEPDGTIDGRYGYLFYECATSDFGQRSAGWVVPQAELKAFFTTNLRETGFIQQEIDDFTEWWIPSLNTADYYAIYPQYAAQLDPVIALSFSQQPDNILRLTYYVQPLDSPNLTLPAPTIPAFERTGFVATEWGVIRLPERSTLVTSN